MIRSSLARCLLFALACLIAACGGAATSPGSATPSSPEARAESAAAPAPTDNASEAATAPPAGAPASEPVTTDAPARTRCEDPSSADTGRRCTTSVFEPTLSFTLPPGWVPDDEYGEEPHTLGFLAEDGSPVYLGVVRVAQAFDYTDEDRPVAVDVPADLAAHLADLPAVRASAPQQVTVAGREAMQVDLEIVDLPPVLPTSECGDALEPALYVFELASGMRSAGENTRVMTCEYYYLLPGTVARAVVVDLEGEDAPLVLVMEATPDTRDELFTEFDAMLATMRVGEG